MDIAATILLLSELPGVGEKTLGTVLRRCSVQGREAGSLFCLSARELQEFGFGERSAEALLSATDALKQAAIATAKSLRAAGVQLLTSGDPAYPKRLLERLAEPAPVLFAYGSIATLSGPTFAVANSNGASEEAMALCDVASEQLVQSGWRPITGHNRAAYQRTALTALRFGGRICYVLDRGLLEAFGDDLRRELFPAAHVWSRAYDPTCTLTVTPFPLRAHGIADHNRRRDSLIFALADTVLVGQVSPGGQMERCVREALEHGRRVCLVGPVGSTEELFLQSGAERGISGIL
jgi:predicted Rossmann fold nucleotide-binding protein DprA/Smf involved in DNA uptake